MMMQRAEEPNLELNVDRIRAPRIVILERDTLAAMANIAVRHTVVVATLLLGRDTDCCSCPCK